jgi:hypothetical protein
MKNRAAMKNSCGFLLVLLVLFLIGLIFIGRSGLIKHASVIAASPPDANGSPKQVSTTWSREAVKEARASGHEESYDQRVARLTAEANATIDATDAPIEFFGRVIDQASVPIPDVEVSFKVTQYNRAVPHDMLERDGKTITDANGVFTIQNVRGNALAIQKLAKNGYVPVGLEPRWYLFALLPTQSGEIFRSEASSPIVYKMWRLGAREELQSCNFFGEAKVDGTPLYSTTGSGLLAGRLRFVFRRGAIRTDSPFQYDWSLQVLLEGGDLMQSSDRTMYAAPSDGYQKELSFLMTAANPNWTKGAEIYLYARTAKGNYGRFTITVTGPSDADQTTAKIRIEGALNPRGSPNLEPSQ